MIRTIGQARRLTAFLTAYRFATTEMTVADQKPSTDLPTRLAAFLAAYRRFPRSVPPSQIVRQSINSSQLATTLSALRAPLADKRTAGVLLNPWIIAGLRRNEVRNAAVLANFLSPALCGRLAVDFLNALVEPLRLRSAAAIPSVLDLEAGYHVRTEHYVIGSGRDRVDLTIEGGNFVLGIEIKIDASEGRRQLERYAETIQRWGQRQGKSAAVILLAPFASDHPNVCSVSWRSVVAASREVVPLKKADRTEAQSLLRLFVSHISTF